MRRDVQPPTGGIYRTRNPRVSPLYQCVRRHGDELAEFGQAISASSTINRTTKLSRRRSRQFIPRRFELQTAPAYLASATGPDGRSNSLSSIMPT